MDKPVSIEKQLQKLSDYKTLLDLGLGDSALVAISTYLNSLNNNLKNIIVEDKKISEYPEYESHLSIFLNIYENRFDKKELLSVLDINLNDYIEKFKNKEMKNTEDLVQDIIKKINIEKLNEMNNVLSIPINKLNELLRGIEEYEKVNKDISNQQNLDTIRFLVENLYKNSFELYLKILKSCYEKITKKKKFDNLEMYNYYNAYYPLLLGSTNNLLRNDIAHVGYKEKDKYTTGQINEDKKIIIVKLFTALIAKDKWLVNFFDKSSKVALDNWDKLNLKKK